MNYRTLISPRALHCHLQEPGLVVVDCRFSLDDPDRGRRDYERCHIPGAVYAHLDEDLSGPVVPGQTGRHPLPDPENFARTLSNLGIGNESQVVVYDDAAGMMAARLWWMLKWLGHERVAVLDGAWQSWLREGYPGESESHVPSSATFLPNVQEDLVAEMAEIQDWDPDQACLLDARDPSRYCGEIEPIDPVAGHIPGAVSAPFADSLQDAGNFRPPQDLREDLIKLTAGRPASEVTCYCGSGVTAAHLVLAFEHAGLGRPRLYAGSWSEWITESENPIETC